MKKKATAASLVGEKAAARSAPHSAEIIRAMAKTASREQTSKRLGRSGLSMAAPPEAESVPISRSLHAAKAAKQDEFYTQYVDIQKEVEAYLEFDPGTFRGKVVYCNCDDPFESNFFKYF